MARTFTVDECRQSLDSFIAAAGLSSFFTGGKAPEAVVNAAPQMLKEWQAWSTGAGLFDQVAAANFALHVLNLALYDIHVLVDDSGSLLEGDRTQSIPGSVTLMLHLQNIFRTGGLFLHYIHGDDPGTAFTNSAAVDPQIKNVKYGGPTTLGGTMQKKILSLIGSAGFKKPCLVYLLTDGEPTGEADEVLANVVQAGVTQLQSGGYGPESIAYQLIQIGDDFQTREYLQKQLLENSNVNRHVDVILEDTDLEKSYRASKNLPVQSDDILVIRLLVGAIRPAILR